MNNLLKNIGIWLVIGLVVLTVVKQFNTRQGSKDSVAYSEFMDEAKAGKVESASDRGPHDQVDVDGQEALRHLQPRRHLDGRRPGQVRRQGRGQARGGAELPRADLRLLVPDAAADRRVDLLHAPDAGRRARRRVLASARAGAHARRVEQHGHLRRRRRLRRGQGRSRRAGRVPARPVEVPEARRPHSARRADGRQAGHRQDAARPGDRRRGEGAVLLDLGLRLRRDVRRRRRRARARHVRAGEEERALHRVHRRDRRGRPPARRGPGRRQRRARADAEPAAGRDGRLRGQRGRDRHRRDQPARTCSTRRCCARAASTARSWCRCPTSAAASRSCSCTCARCRWRPTSRPTSSRAARRASPAPTSPTSSTRRRCSPRATNKRLVDMDDFERAKDKIIMGAERRSMVMPEEERRNTAYHESGHAIVAQAAAQDRPGAQGDDHPARPRARRDDAAARPRTATAWTASSC